MDENAEAKMTNTQKTRRLIVILEAMLEDMNINRGKMRTSTIRQALQELEKLHG